MEGGVMTNFAKAARLVDVKEGELLPAEVDGTSICLTRVDGTVYAFSNDCSHEGGPLHEGYLDDHVVVCPWHCAEFDIQTGKILDGPTHQSITTYPVKVDDESVLVLLPQQG
jgi:3-phenylpropionate/trans-cinnamate dioxygenase ferredoxin component